MIEKFIVYIRFLHFLFAKLFCRKKNGMESSNFLIYKWISNYFYNMHNIHTWNVLASYEIDVFLFSLLDLWFDLYCTDYSNWQPSCIFYISFFPFQIRTPSKRYLSKPPLWYKEPLFLVALAAVSIVIIIVVVAILCVKSKSYKYKGIYNIRSLNIYKDNLILYSTILQTTLKSYFISNHK